MSPTMLAILTVGQLIVDRPCRAHVLTRLGIDPWCHGRKNLPRLCAEAGLKLDAVLTALNAADQAEKPCDSNCAKAVLVQLINHIEQVHHAFARRTLPHIQSLIEQSLPHDTDRCPLLPKLRQAFASFQAELVDHMDKEERILFAACRNLAGHGIGRRQFNQAVQDMLDEHGESGHCMETLRAFTNDYTSPPDASPHCSALHDALRNLEDDLHRHMFEENNILTPLALSLAGTAAPSGLQLDES